MSTKSTKSTKSTTTAKATTGTATTATKAAAKERIVVAEQRRQEKAAARAEKKRATTRDKHLQQAVNAIKKSVYEIRNSHKTIKGVILDLMEIAKSDKRAAIIFAKWLKMNNLQMFDENANAVTRNDFFFKIKKLLPLVRKTEDGLRFFKLKKIAEKSDETLTAYSFEKVDETVNVDPLSQIITLMLADLTDSATAKKNMEIAKYLDINNLSVVVFYDKKTKKVYTK